MKQLSQKSITVQASQIRIMFQEALQHPGCLNLSIGEPDFCTPPPHSGGPPNAPLTPV